jgi:hypothetical protein
MEAAGVSGSDGGGGMDLSDGNGLVPDEDERYCHHEMRCAAKTVGLRKSKTVQKSDGNEAWQRAVFLAMAPAPARVSGAS